MCNSQQSPLHNPKLEVKKNISWPLKLTKVKLQVQSFSKKKKKSKPSHWLQQVHPMQNKSEQPLSD